MNTEKTLRKEIAHILMFVLTSKDIPVATDQIIKAVENLIGEEVPKVPNPYVGNFSQGDAWQFGFNKGAEFGSNERRTEFLRKLGEK